MSILTDLLHRKITFKQAVDQAGQWASQVSAKDPTLAAAAGAVLSDLKQAGSNALSMADEWIAPHLADAAKAVEAAVDGVMLKATAGGAAPLIPLVNDGLDRIAAALKAEIDAATARAKAQLAANPLPVVSPAAPPPPS